MDEQVFIVARRSPINLLFSLHPQCQAGDSGDDAMNGRDSESVSSSRVHLRLVTKDDKNSDVEVFLAIPSDAKILRELILEAEAIEAWYGLNAYSSFIKKNGRRPDRTQAATIGRLLGGRVEAEDGTMQPALTESDREVLRGIRSRRRAASRRYDHILRLREAIAALSENEDDPADVIGTGSCLLNESAISAQLDMALCWLIESLRNGMAGKRKLAPQVCSLLSPKASRIATRYG